MSVDFSNIYEHVVPGLRWPFEQEDKLPEHHIEQIQVLDAEASKFLEKHIGDSRLHIDMPYKRDFFRTLDQIYFGECNEQEVKKWLYHRGFPFEKKVFLSSGSCGMIVSWKLLVKYAEHFQHLDDLTVFDESLTWALLFFHEGDIYFGTNKNFVPETTEEVKFSY